jgi:hypothetical protein
MFCAALKTKLSEQISISAIGCRNINTTLICSGHLGLFFLGESVSDMKLTTHLCLFLRLLEVSANVSEFV